MNAPSLRNALLLVSLSLGLPQLRKLDKKVSAEVAIAKNASLDAGRYNKLLVPEVVSKRMVSVVNAARNQHYLWTLPWADEGWRALPATAFVDYENDMAEHRRRFDVMKSEVVADYEELRHEEKLRLGDLFNPGDYPTTDTFATRFRFAISYRPVPDAGDFRVALADDAVESIRTSIASQMQDAHQQAMRDCFERANRAVEHMAATLAKPIGNAFRDSLVENIEELVGILPKLNYAQDPRLTLLVQEMRDKLTGNPQRLRDDPTERVAKQAAAAKINDMLKGWLR